MFNSTNKKKELNVFFKLIITRPACSRDKIPNKLALKRANLILKSLVCETAKENTKNQCLPKESFLRYRCRNGYIFETKKSK